MSPTKAQRAARGRCEAMSDEDLTQLERQLKGEIPRAQSLLDAVRKEKRNRRKTARRFNVAA